MSSSTLVDVDGVPTLRVIGAGDRDYSFHEWNGRLKVAFEHVPVRG